MTVQAYLFIVLILAVLLDLGLLFWVRRDLERRGITMDDERAVFLFKIYSPILTWLNCVIVSVLEIRNKHLKLPQLSKKKWGSGLIDKALKEEFHRKNIRQGSMVSARTPARVHLRFQISRNERIQITFESLPANQKGGVWVAGQTIKPGTSTPGQVGSSNSVGSESDSIISHPDVKVASKINKEQLRVFSFFAEQNLFTDLIVVFLALIPVVLVVMDRWLKKPLLLPGFNKYWEKIASSIGLDFPAYFSVILFSILLMIILIFLRKEAFIDINDQNLIQEKHPHTIVSNAHSLRWAKLLFFGSGICFFLALFFSIRMNAVAGRWFLLAVSVYIVGWLLQSVSIQELFVKFKKNGAVILSYAVFCLALLYLLAAINLEWNYRWLYLLVVVLMFVNALRYFRRIYPIFWSVPLFMILYTYRINGWEFSVIGDEYSFFDYAKNLATERSLSDIVSHIFDGHAVFGSHPFFSSLLQAIPMTLFGANNFGWRISNILFVSASIPLFYYYFRAYTSQFIAMTASFLIGASHYLMTFGKIGYNNLQAFFVMALLLAVSAWTVKIQSKIQYVLLGLSLGLCFYVYPAALYILGVWLIFMLYHNPPNTKDTIRNWLTMGGMFFLLVLPLLLQPDYWRIKVAGTLLYSPALLENLTTISKHIFNNVLYSFFSFLFLPEESHFVTVSYVDPLTASLMLLGLFFSLSRMWQNRFLTYNFISFGALLFMVGATHDRHYPPTTRMFMLLPWFAFFASLGLRWLYNLFTRITIQPIKARIFLAAILVAVLMLNLYHAYSLTVHRSSRYQSQEMLFLRLVQYMQTKPDADNSTTRFIFLTDGTWDIDGYRKLQEVYAIPEAFMELDRYAVVKEDWPFSIMNTIQNPNTLVIVNTNLSQDILTGISANLSTLHKEACPIVALDGSVRFYLWYSSQMRWVCENI